MTLTNALNRSISGHTVVSCAGRVYAPEQIGEAAYAFNSCGMTEKERKGTFKLSEEETK